MYKNMRAADYLHIAKSIVRARVLKQKTPLIVTWALTHKCNLACGYCGCHQQERGELDTEQIVNLAKELQKCGAKYVVLSGGEVLLRADIKEIIGVCRQGGMYTVLNTNGLLIKKKINEIKGINEVKLSLDGPKDVHDGIRNKDGIYDRVIEAIRICKDEGIKVYINTVLSIHNLSSFSHVLGIAEQFKVGVLFQPATQNQLGVLKVNYLAPPIEEYRKSILFLIKDKQGGNSVISNTLAGLRHLYFWPEPTPMVCFAKLLNCHIAPDGKISGCSRFLNFEKLSLPKNTDIMSVLKKINIPDCAACWCGAAVDLNLAVKLNNIETLLGIWSRIK